MPSSLVCHVPCAYLYFNRAENGSISNEYVNLFFLRVCDVIKFVELHVFAVIVMVLHFLNLYEWNLME